MRSEALVSAALSGSRSITKVILGMSGVVAGHMTAPRYLSIIGSYALYLLLKAHASLPLAGGYFLAALLVHYLYLFGMLRPGGWSRTLRQRYGDERAFRLHESWMAFVFCHNALSTAFICYATRDLPALGLSLPPMSPIATWMLASALVAAGMGAKVWATLVVGMDAYYYRDLFLAREPASLEARGPYRYFDDPMYTVGHLQAYGLALSVSSTWGVLAVAANQALVLGFNYVVEQPHMRRMRKEAAKRLRPALAVAQPYP